MTPVLQTRRLQLRPLAGAADIDAAAHWLSDYDVAQWLTMVPWPYARKDAAWFIDEFCQRPDAGPHWAIDAGAGMIGVISLEGRDLGYWLGKPFHGRGYMTEAVEAVIAWAFDQAPRDVVSGHFLANDASRQVLRKVGFVDTHEDTVTRHADRRPMPIQRMRLTPADWQQRPSIS